MGCCRSCRLFGAVNSLAQVVLKSAVPGVPDFYQGSELWELSLVDPDNRRPVDYDLRAGYLDALHELAEQEGPWRGVPRLLGNLADGRAQALDDASRAAVAAAGTCDLPPGGVHPARSRRGAPGTRDRISAP